MTSKAQEYKSQGNELFQKGDIAQAIQAYSLGIQHSNDSQLQAVLYSNRAACYLKLSKLQECIDDCTCALDLSCASDIRTKLLYKRAKARFLLTETDENNNNKQQLLQEAAQDLLTLLSMDSKNKEATTLLQAIRAKAALQQGSPISNTLDEVPTNPDHSCKVLLGLLTNDPSCAMELGRLGGIPTCCNLGTTLGLQVVACACSYAPFVQTFCSTQISQSKLADIVDNRDNAVDYKMAALSIWLRLVMYLDESANNTSDGESRIDAKSLVRTCRAALQSQDPRLLQASLEVLSSWTSVGDANECKSEEEIRKLKPRELAAYKKQQYELLQHNKQWNNDRSLLFLRQGGLDTILDTAINCENHVMQREMGVVLGRMFSCIETEDVIKNVVKPLLNFHQGVTIEEVHTDFDEKEEECSQHHGQLYEPSKRAQLTTSLLLGVPQVGVWALSRVGGIDELRELINSENENAMFLASEVVSAAASVEQARPLLANLPLDVLLESNDYDIRSGAASALAKLGLADKALSANEGEVMGLLQISVELLYDEKTEAIEEQELLPNIKRSDESTKPTTAIERGVEVLSYLASKTQVKEELAFGFRPSPDSPSTALDRLVELASAPEAGESLSAYGLATIFSLMAVSIQTLRREAFAGKEISMEQYDELQALGKTSEEKDLAPEEALDSPASVQERIRRMASANVPRALVKLMDGASDSTVEQIIAGLNRMASEPSVRGLIVQQGALSACLKVEKGENPSESGKKILREARHCISKLLVSTNPALLTSSQRMGSIKPLIQLIRDHDATDLQQFEALLAITNLASADDETKERIVAEKGISTLSYAMFSDHEMVQRAATEAMCNLVPHPAMMKHLADPEHLRLWLAFASDVEANFECARAAAGCLAMSTYDPDIAKALVELKSFKESMTTMLECGNLEVMHRALVIVLNLVEQGGKCREAVISSGLIAFCEAYVASYHDGKKADELHFSAADQQQMAVTVDVAKEIVRQVEQG